MDGYKQYKEKSIYSMSPLELLLMVYDEAVKNLMKAEYALNETDYEKFDDSLERTTRIVRYLTDILDMRQPISRDLKRIYHYLIYDISRVKAGRARQKDELERIRHILSELGDGFDQASRKVHDTHIAVRPEVRG